MEVKMDEVKKIRPTIYQVKKFFALFESIGSCLEDATQSLLLNGGAQLEDFDLPFRVDGEYKCIFQPEELSINRVQSLHGEAYDEIHPNDPADA